MGISRAFTNIIAALALDPRPFVAEHASGKRNQASAGHTTSNKDRESPHMLPGLMCSAVTVELVPLLQPIMFSSLPDHVLGSTAGLSQAEKEQLKYLRPALLDR
jgi:hypothetical protein